MITRTSTILLEGLRSSSDGAHWREFDSRYRPLLLSVGRRMGLAASDAEDAAQECIAAFLVDYRAGSYHRDRGRLRDWLAGIMAHKVRDQQRRRQREEAVAQKKLCEFSPDSADDDPICRAAIEQEWSRAVLRQCLEEVRQEVPPQMFESFELVALRQRPAREVARQLGISTDLVYQNKHRVLRRIRDLLPEMENTW